jgi:hypothetical protein
VQAYAALGCQITRNIYCEVGYRYLYDDFRDEGATDFLYQMSLHDAQISPGLNSNCSVSQARPEAMDPEVVSLLWSDLSGTFV